MTRRITLRLLVGLFCLPLVPWLKSGIEVRSGWVLRKTDD